MLTILHAPLGMKIEYMIQVWGEDGVTSEQKEVFDVLFVSFNHNDKSLHPDEMEEYYGVMFDDGIVWIRPYNQETKVFMEGSV